MNKLYQNMDKLINKAMRRKDFAMVHKCLEMQMKYKARQHKSEPFNLESFSDDELRQLRIDMTKSVDNVK